MWVVLDEWFTTIWPWPCSEVKVKVKWPSKLPKCHFLSPSSRAVFQPISSLMMDSDTRGQYLNLAGTDFWISSPVTYHVTLNFSTMDNWSIFRVRNFGYEWTDQMAVLIFWIYSLISTIICKKLLNFRLRSWSRDLRFQCAKNRKNSLVSHHRTTLSGYIFASKACIDNRKKNSLSSNISSTGPCNMLKFPIKEHKLFPL